MVLDFKMPRLANITSKKKSRVLLRTGTLKKPRNLQSQDYQELLDKCLKSKQLFVDGAFPADLTSIGSGRLLKKLPEDVQWKRPHELVRNPQFFTENPSEFALHQGLTENCWFLAALCSLTFHPDILTNVVPANQSFGKNYSGIFHFRVSKCSFHVRFFLVLN
ncbi:hypothetical protein GDO86_019330 [Hymenochirus boettgeri]|uniref:Calpain catalytic domain-containing protein n=1 Tax=Hymenochirus boettgeri TaxID=247094 RepID=A0A8T2IHW7_9PIPI|nr:hypothetical protein GDO86_019330 [Hymenochirus boettgeri]